VLENSNNSITTNDNLVHKAANNRGNVSLYIQQS